jgi:hypothetical protein
MRTMSLISGALTTWLSDPLLRMTMILVTMRMMILLKIMVTTAKRMKMSAVKRILKVLTMKMTPARTKTSSPL